MLNVLDLFSGGGGLAQGLERWARPVAYCEIEPGAQRVLMSRIARGELCPAPVWDDVRTLRGDMLPEVDIIAGGFPCQDISVAGAGAGLDGERSGLVFEYLRLVGECRPRFVFMENVPALAVRGLDRVLLGLNALGYDARWTIVSAAEVGAPHLRERIWILAHASGERVWLEPEPEPRGSAPPEPLSDGSQEPLADANGNGGFQVRARKQVRQWRPDAFGAGPRELGGWWAVEPDVGRVAHGVADRVNRLRVLGNGVVPASAREAFIRLSGLSRQRSSETC